MLILYIIAIILTLLSVYLIRREGVTLLSMIFILISFCILMQEDVQASSDSLIDHKLEVQSLAEDFCPSGQNLNSFRYTAGSNLVKFKCGQAPVTIYVPSREDALDYLEEFSIFANDVMALSKYKHFTQLDIILPMPSTFAISISYPHRKHLKIKTSGEDAVDIAKNSIDKIHQYSAGSCSRGNFSLDTFVMSEIQGRHIGGMKYYCGNSKKVIRINDNADIDFNLMNNILFK